MFFKVHKSLTIQFVVILALLGGLFGVIPVKASSNTIPQINISTPSYPVGMNSRESKLITYSLTESGNVSGEITSRIHRFYTQYDVPLSDSLGPYPTSIKINPLATSRWNELVYLPESVVSKARALEEYAIVVKTTFLGESSSGADFSAETSLLLLLPPAAFSKDNPSNGATLESGNQSLQWNSSVGAIDYEYCFDTVDNNSCDTDWTGTYWLGTYDTNATLRNLPSDTTFYWQVRANNTAGTTYANDSTWWSFTTTSCNSNLITVTNANDSGTGSLRQAIIDICPGGTINFDPSLAGQTITLTSTLEIDKDLGIDGSSLSSMININGNNSVRLFLINPDVIVTLNGLKVVNGYNTSPGGGGVLNVGTLNILNSIFSGNEADGAGGGAVFNSGILNIVNSTFSGNNAREGGALNNNADGTVSITNSTFSENSADFAGGIINYETLSIIGSTLSFNSGTKKVGGIFNYGMLTVANSTFFSNSSGGTFTTGSGGGIFNEFTGEATIIDSTFSENIAKDSGGGIYNYGKVTLTNSTFQKNSVTGYGGGIYNSGTTTITNSTFFGNTTAGNGGGSYNAGTLTITNSTFSSNSATNGGGILSFNTLNLYNTIVANSSAGDDCLTYVGTIVYGINNLIEGTSNACSLTSGIHGNIIGLDPNLGSLSNNGGPTPAMALLPGSPAIDAGDDASCPTADQRGVTRPQGAQCDIGAYEAEPYEITVTRMGDFNGDGKAEIAVFRPSTSTWFIYGVGSFIYGTVGDIPVVADYNGDGKDDIAVFRPSNSTWYIRGLGEFVYGTVGDVPVVADYNGDGRDDIAVFRPSNSTWYIRGLGEFVYGMVGDVPVVADYNGDGRDDIAIFRPATSTWYIRGAGEFLYGALGDIPVIADYNGDKKADIAVFRPSTSTWYIRGAGEFLYGALDDIPVIADYNGDKKVDIAVFRPSTSTWYIYGVGHFLYGTIGDIPV